VLADHHDMAEAAFQHFDNLLGTDVPHDHTLDLTDLVEPVSDLVDLDTPFSVEEIWSTIKRLPARKAPRPDGCRVHPRLLEHRQGWTRCSFPAAIRATRKRVCEAQPSPPNLAP
jgi:hypothetical protein